MVALRYPLLGGAGNGPVGWTLEAMPSGFFTAWMPDPPDHAPVPAGMRARQYTARPPEMSKTPPVVKEQSSVASQPMIAATSSTSTKRFIGIFDSM